jgi:transposase
MNNVFHPDYGYTDAIRLRACKTAMILGKKEAAKKHKVSITSIYTWLKVYSFDAIMRVEG